MLLFLPEIISGLVPEKNYASLVVTLIGIILIVAVALLLFLFKYLFVSFVYFLEHAVQIIKLFRL